MSFIPIIPIPIITLISLFMIVINKKDPITISIIVLLFVINLRPIITNEEINLNILFVIDTTYSMNDSYKETTKINQVKKDTKEIINYFPNSNISIITFDNSSNIISPFTSNKIFIENSINNIKPIDKIYANGSSLNTPLPTLSNYLKDKNNVILFFLSDGENTQDENYKKYHRIKNYISDGIVIGYQDNNQSLREISNNLNINYYKSIESDKIKYKINKIINLHNKNNHKKIELYYLLLIPLIILLLIETHRIRRYLWKI